jgi:hypothetical protein
MERGLGKVLTLLTRCAMETAWSMHCRAIFSSKVIEMRKRQRSQRATLMMSEVNLKE